MSKKSLVDRNDTGWGWVLIVITALEIIFFTVQQGNNKKKSLGGVKKDTIVS